MFQRLGAVDPTLRTSPAGLLSGLQVRQEASQSPGRRNDEHATLRAAEEGSEVAPVSGYEPAAPTIDGCSQNRRVLGRDLRGRPCKGGDAGCRTQRTGLSHTLERGHRVGGLERQVPACLLERVLRRECADQASRGEIDKQSRSILRPMGCAEEDVRVEIEGGQRLRAANSPAAAARSASLSVPSRSNSAIRASL